jgi:hypothetical protein
MLKSSTGKIAQAGKNIEDNADVYLDWYISNLSLAKKKQDGEKVSLDTTRPDLDKVAKTIVENLISEIDALFTAS